ncbi:MAG: iron ABC transporter permease [Limnohabitans sp.]|nr:iron ABC transporter permease [Limnohabitans sp.]
MLFISLLRLFLIFVMALPVLMVLGAWLQWNDVSQDALAAMADSVLPGYVWGSVRLCFWVTLGVIIMGGVSAAVVTLFDFPAKRILEWALLLPLAVPAYVVAYAYSDFLQYSGPPQTLWREITGWQGPLWPDVRNLWGAAAVLSCSLYPYVYILVRAALVERAPQLMEAARLLGASLPRRMARVALPLARPAIAAGTALALMETLADFGVSSYFGVTTFSTGIYKAWLVMDDRIAAAQLATFLLLLVSLMLGLEQRAQLRMRFNSQRTAGGGNESQPLKLHGPAAMLALLFCAMPVLLGFVFPLLIMARSLWLHSQSVALPWGMFGHWMGNSLFLGLITAFLAVNIALVLAFSLRVHPNSWRRISTQWVGLGYAVPGVVIVVGLLLPVAWIQKNWPQTQAGYWLTATVLGLIWAYLVRFIAVALQSVQSGYSRIAMSMDETSRMQGVYRFMLFYRVHWPLLKRSTAAAALLVLVDVMKELPATLVLRPFNTDTLAVMAYQLARDERLGEAALPSLALVLIGLVPVVLLSRTLRNS